ncbi:hypothetical protein ACFWNE_33380 [Streptomyces goshikiensis]|uniref:hypothetical protein n=1 Tax=Streptomyces goshikiensis TaxID=1942 RepID=UPI00365DCD92
MSPNHEAQQPTARINRSVDDAAGLAVTSKSGAEASGNPELTVIPASEVKPEDMGALSLRYVDGVPQLVVSGGTVIPAGLTVVDGAGNAVASYTADSSGNALAKTLQFVVSAR